MVQYTIHMSQAQEQGFYGLQPKQKQDQRMKQTENEDKWCNNSSGKLLLLSQKNMRQQTPEENI